MFIAIIAILFYFVFPALLKPETDIIALLPQSENSFADNSIKEISAEASKEILFLISANDVKSAILMGEEFVMQIRKSKAFESVDPMRADEMMRAGLALYAPFKYCILPEKTISLLSTKGLPAALQQSLEILQSPLSAFYADFINTDPLFNAPLYLQESAPQNQNQIIEKGYLLLKNENKYYFVINAHLASSAFEKGTHDILMPDIKIAEKNLKSKYPEFNMLKSGLVFFAERASVTAQNEISWLGSISILGVILLMLVVFRSFKQVLLSLLAIGVGVLVALTITLMVFPKIHLVTLTFGTSLIGVSIDYSTHYFADYLFNKNNWTPKDCLKRIGSGISWGAFTTILAFAAIAINPLPGLHQIAVFSVAGVIGAYVTVMFAFPYFLSSTEKAAKPFTFVSKFFEFIFIYPHFIVKYKKLFFSTFALMLLGFFFIQSDDDIRSLQSPPADLLQNEKLVHQMLHKYETARFILIRSDSAENLLQKEESIKPLLKELISKNAISHFFAISQFLPSQAQQSKNHLLLKQALLNKESSFTEEEKNILESTDFNMAYHTEGEPKKLTPANFYASPFGKKFKNLLHYEATTPFSLILLQSVKPDADKTIQETFKNQKDVFYINKIDQISETLKQMREQIIISTLLVYILIYLLLCFKFGIKKGFFIIVVPAFAATSSLILVALSGQNLHISHTLAIIIVLGTGIDYTIFLAESPTQKNATTLAIALSAITTILSFGLLTFCQTEFLSAFGLVILIGVSLSYLLAPMFFTNRIESQKNT